jgi:hypothetical protein
MKAAAVVAAASQLMVDSDYQIREAEAVGLQMSIHKDVALKTIVNTWDGKGDTQTVAVSSL